MELKSKQKESIYVSELANCSVKQNELQATISSLKEEIKIHIDSIQNQEKEKSKLNVSIQHLNVIIDTYKHDMEKMKQAYMNIEHKNKQLEEVIDAIKIQLNSLHDAHKKEVESLRIKLESERKEIEEQKNEVYRYKLVLSNINASVGQHFEYRSKHNSPSDSKYQWKYNEDDYSDDGSADMCDSKKRENRNKKDYIAYDDMKTPAPSRSSKYFANDSLKANNESEVSAMICRLLCENESLQQANMQYKMKVEEASVLHKQMKHKQEVTEIELQRMEMSLLQLDDVIDEFENKVSSEMDIYGTISMSSILGAFLQSSNSKEGNKDINLSGISLDCDATKTPPKANQRSSNVNPIAYSHESKDTTPQYSKDVGVSSSSNQRHNRILRMLEAFIKIVHCCKELITTNTDQQRIITNQSIQNNELLKEKEIYLLEYNQELNRIKEVHKNEQTSMMDKYAELLEEMKNLSNEAEVAVSTVATEAEQEIYHLNMQVKEFQFKENKSLQEEFNKNLGLFRSDMAVENRKTAEVWISYIQYVLCHYMHLFMRVDELIIQKKVLGQLLTRFEIVHFMFKYA